MQRGVLVELLTSGFPAAVEVVAAHKVDSLLRMLQHIVHLRVEAHALLLRVKDRPLLHEYASAQILGVVLVGEDSVLERALADWALDCFEVMGWLLFRVHFLGQKELVFAVPLLD